jgi:hypothetical protein
LNRFGGPNEHEGEEVEVSKTGSKYHHIKDRDWRVRIEDGIVVDLNVRSPVVIGKCWQNRESYIESSRLGVLWILIRRSFETYTGECWKVPPHMTYETALRIARDLKIEVKMN